MSTIRVKRTTWSAPLMAVSIAVLVLAAVIGQSLSIVLDGAARPEPGPVSATGAPSPIASPTANPVGGFESPILGYAITLPATYRHIRSLIEQGQAELGYDMFTSRSEADERADCLRDSGDLPTPALAELLLVRAFSNAAGVSAVDWAKTSPYKTPRATVEAATIGGREAARLAEDGKIFAYVIRANDRMYLISPTTWPTQHSLDSIAATFRATTPVAFPAATPPAQAPRAAAAKVGEALAKAFAARDADAVAAVMTGCSIGVSAIVEPQNGSGGCCIVNRAIAPFIEALRDAFASRALTVIVDPTVEVRTQAQGNDRYFVRSTWSEPDRTMGIDLFLGERDGSWHWLEALHHYQRADLVNGVCVVYRSPWVTTTQRC